MKRIIKSIFGILLLCSTLTAQEEIKLYHQGPNESNGITEKETMDDNSFVINITEPRMYAYNAPKEIASGAAVLICPGGGYWGVSVENEGTSVAKYLNKLGVSAFVLYYRMPNQHPEIPLKDAQTAMQIIRKRAKEWNIDPHKVGIAGFSAGGHLASTAGTHFNKKNRPDFMILGYPVISMNKDITHGGSRKNLIGETPSAELEKRFSNELQVTEKTPPTFIVVATDDKTVPVENSYLFYKALQAKNVPAKIYTFDIGGHGFGMRKSGIEADKWPELLRDWLKDNKLIN